MIQIQTELQKCTFFSDKRTYELHILVTAIIVWVCDWGEFIELNTMVLSDSLFVLCVFSSAEQLVLYMKCAELLSTALHTAMEAIKEEKLYPSASVKQGKTLHHPSVYLQSSPD